MLAPNSLSSASAASALSLTSSDPSLNQIPLSISSAKRNLYRTFKVTNLLWITSLHFSITLFSVIFIYRWIFLVVPVLFQNSLKEGEEEQNVESLSHVFGVEPMRITSPSTDAEIALALRVLEGCCLLHRESTVFAHQYKAIQVVIRIGF